MIGLFSQAYAAALAAEVSAQLGPPVLKDEHVLAVSTPWFPDIDLASLALNTVILTGSIKGYGSGGDVISIQLANFLSGVAQQPDTGNNYYDYAATIPAVSASGTNTATVSGTATVTTNKMRMGLPTSKWRSFCALLSNYSGGTIGMSAMVQIGSTSPPGTTNVLHLGVTGEWNSPGPISKIRLLTDLGRNMFAGSSFQILGWPQSLTP